MNRATARAFPTLLRVGMAETLAYRAEFVVWMLTTTLPLIMLGLWSSVAAEGPFASFGQREFVAYYLATLVVRNLTGSWVVWQINDEIRTGTLSMRLLRPVHPFVTYAALHLSAIPLRALVALPFTVLLLVSTAGDLLVTDARLLIFAVSLAGAWVLTFFAMMLIGSLGLFLDKSLAVFDVYLGLFAVLSGYLVPLALLPGWAQAIASAAPFRYMLAFPVELLTGRLSFEEALVQLGIQLAYAAVVVAAALRVWRAGIRRYEAYGS